MSDAPAGFAPVQDGPPDGFKPVARAPQSKFESMMGVANDFLEKIPLLGMPSREEQARRDQLSVGQHVGEILMDPRTTAPVTGLGGVAAKALGAPAVLGRVATAAGLGGAAGALTDGAAGYHALLDGAVAAITEGALSGVSKLPKVGLEKTGAPARAFKWATNAPVEAWEALKARLPGGKWLNVPSLSSSLLTAEEAVKKLAKLTGKDYQLAREEIASEFTRLDAQRMTGPKPFAGKVFKGRTSPERFEPSTLSSVAEAARGALDSNAVRAGADAIAGTPYEGVPLGAVAAAALPDQAASVARRALPFVGHFGH